MVCMTLPSREADSNFQFPATVSFVKPRYSSFFCREGADVALSVPLKSGTTSSNPVPSSKQSVSRTNRAAAGREPRVSRGCAPLCWRRGGQRRAGPGRKRPNRHRYLCRGIIQYRSAADVRVTTAVTAAQLLLDSTA